MNHIFARVAALLLVFTVFAPDSFAQKKPSVKNAPAKTTSTQAVTQVPRELTQEQAVTNLRAFAKLYGYVRYFHPSDEALRVNWEQFAIYGASKVKTARTMDELKSALETLFLPIAPTLQILNANEKPISDAVPGNPVQHQVVAWQHRGMELGASQFSGGSMYRSIRLNKANIVTGSLSDFGTMTQCLDTSSKSITSVLALRGQQIKLTAAVRADVKGSNNRGQLWLRVDKPNRKTGFFNNMDDRPITMQQWSEYSVIGDVDSNAIGLCYGCFLKGRGKVWVDDIRIFIRKNNKEEWRPIALTNPSFEEFSSTTTGTIFKGWSSSPQYSFTPTQDSSYFGVNSVLIEDKGQAERSFRGELFTTKPSGGETLLKNLAGGLRCALPVALYTDSISTLGTTPKSAQDLGWMLNTLEGYDGKHMMIEQEPTRLASVIMAWNALQHSYPYFDVIGTNWDSILTTTLAEALVKPSAPEFRMVMRKMLEHLCDGHADYYQGTPNLLLPVSAENIEGQLIVLASQDSLLKRGDIIVNIDGNDTRTLLANEEAVISGSPQWKRAKAVLGLLYTPDKTVQLTVNRNGQILTIATERKWYRRIYEYPSTKKIRGSTPTDAVWYVDMSQMPKEELREKISEFAQAKGVIIDLRGYPNNNDILHHLTDTVITSARWNIPQILYPDQERLVGYDTSGRWAIQPKMPRIKGKIVFLTGGGAISYAESVMGIVEHYKLGEIVGATTAAANGNVNSLSLPGRANIYWTGMKVLKHDGSQHHLIGIKPTVPASRTIQGIRDGRDEVLEKALSLIP